jgi:hypothetical protein
MNLKSIKLDNASYHEYLEGKEILCNSSSVANKSLHEGEHVLVYKDTVTANTTISPPKSEMQSQYIGVEGEVRAVKSADGDQQGILIKKV